MSRLCRTRRTLVLIWITVVAGSGTVSQAAEVSESWESGTHKMLVPQRVMGIRRSYYVHVPAVSTKAAQLPVVIALHGAFDTARSFERESGLSSLADREGFLVIYPQGIGLGDLFRHWNAGYCCGKARKINLDDVGFVLGTVDDVAKRIPVDRKRVYVAGFSNGGMLAYRIAAEHPDLVAAAAVVAGTIGGKPSENEPEWSLSPPSSPVSVIAIHGRADTHVPYDGGRAARSWSTSSPISVARSIGFWVHADGCETVPQTERIAQGRVQRDQWSGCRSGAEVLLYSLDAWGHEWPNEASLPGFDATEIIWRFFDRHRLPP